MTSAITDDHTVPALISVRRALRICDEIAFLEDRLNEMGYAGDCAYEHALSRAYTERLSERRRELANISKRPAKSPSALRH